MSGRVKAIKITVYVLCAAFALLFALVLRAPASLLPIITKDSGERYGFRLANAQGTLWNGSADVSVVDAPLGRLAWKLPPLALISLSPALDWQLEGTGLSGRLQARENALRAQLEGTLDLSRLAPILSRYAIGAQGRLRFSEVDLRLDAADTRFTGTIDWTGGLVRLRVGSWQGQQLLPAMRASANDSSRIVVTLPDEQAGSPVLAGEVEFLEDGWVKLGASGHLAEKFNESFANAQDPDAIVLSVEERFL